MNNIFFIALILFSQALIGQNIEGFSFNDFSAGEISTKKVPVNLSSHPLGSKIEIIEGSSTDSRVVNEVVEIAKIHSSILLLLDSNHTHEHVLGELDAYANLVSVGSYCVVFDTFVEDMPAGYFADRPWDKGNSPRTAVVEFLKDHSEFVVDESIQNKLLITVAPGGFLKRIQ